MESILNSVKAMLGLGTEYKPFDNELIMHINTTLMILTQLGVGKTKPFAIKGKDEEWSDFVDEGLNLEIIKSYTFLRVRMLFDPPSSAGAMDAIERQVKEFEARITYEVDEINREEKKCLV